MQSFNLKHTYHTFFFQVSGQASTLSFHVAHHTSNWDKYLQWNCLLCLWTKTVEISVVKFDKSAASTEAFKWLKMKIFIIHVKSIILLFLCNCKYKVFSLLLLTKLSTWLGRRSKAQLNELCICFHLFSFFPPKYKADEQRECCLCWPLPGKCRIFFVLFCFEE